jgi:hypothetical protein
MCNIKTTDMKIIKKLTLFAAILISTSFRQSSDELKFSMTAPKNWKKTTNTEIFDNIEKFKLTPTQLEKYITDHKGSVLFVSYSKYDPAKHSGLIPTIQVNIRNNPTKTFDNFFQSMTKSSESIKTYFKDFEYIDKPQKIKVGNKDAFYFSSKFTMSTSSQTIKPRSRTYAIPNGNKFFQVNFTDGDNEDCSKLFDSLVKSIQID